jgi:PBP1b-binding outer membrane lipoprotein LpoB
MKKIVGLGLVLLFAANSVWAQTSQRTTRIQGNTEINAHTNNMTAVAAGRDTVAKNRVGVVQGDKRGDTKISVSASNVVTVVGGRGKRACTNIGGIVSDECK